ncbi:MAG: hypothetical protein SGI90_15125 [Candidatus Eisenbacteria bacterium]|nr:hypothetical protein [Candidatus Eisenbacteria bacterium]
MRQLSRDDLSALLASHESPCISIYLPTHRAHPENQQDPIRYRNLLREVESSLQKTYPTGELRPLLEQFQSLAHDDGFWNYRTDGLAVLGAAGTFRVFDLQRPVPERAVVADSFHLKPLIRILQSADRYQVLCLSRHEAKLYEGNRDALDPVELPEVPSTLTAALGSELTEPHLTVASYGTGPGPGGPMHHGHGGKSDEVDSDRDRFFRVVDRGILEHHSRPSDLPLLLVALAEYHAPFRAVSHNPALLAAGLTTNPEALSIDQLRAKAWEAVEPSYRQRLAGLVEDYGLAASRQLGSDDLAEVARAATAGRVATLLVQADRVIAGRLDAATGRIESGELSVDPGTARGHLVHGATGRMKPGELSDPGIDDILDDLAEAVLRTKGTVVVVPADRLPSDTGVAAIYRY